MKNASFTIYKNFYDQIKNETKNIEYRKYSDFWKKRLTNPTPKIAVFLCGRKVLRKRIRYVEKLSEIDFEHILGRKLSDQGRIDFEIEKYGFVFAIHLGEFVVE